MGKRRGNGSGGGRRSTGPGAPSGDGLVVVNPAMLQAAGAHKLGSSQQRKSKKSKSAKSKCNGTKARKRQPDERLPSQARKKRKQEGAAAVVANVAVSSATRVSRAEGGDAWTSVLRVKSDAELLAGVYWTLLARSKPRCSVVALPNHAPAQFPAPQELSVMLKHLGLQSVGVHRKMPAGQRQESIQRLVTSASAASSSSASAQCIGLVTTEHLLASAACQQADAVLVNASDVSIATAAARFAHVYHVTSAPALATGEASSTCSAFRPELKPASAQQLQARLKLARQVVDILQRLARVGGAQDGDEKWARKLAKGADLDDDDEVPTKKRRRALSPDEQRLQALTEKLYVLVAKPVAGVAAGVKAQDAPEADSQHRREKLEVLGLVTVSAAVGTAMHDERTSAQTQWMDLAVGSAYGGQWDGVVRHGASKDATSLALRRQLCACQKRSPSDGDAALAQWKPNDQPADVTQWGGAFGKVCAHNEVVMHKLRPFFPQEVLNSKVCSKLFPAPGNQGFDGCLEHLRLACAAQKQPMTLWDAEYFVFISAGGHVRWAKKSQLLSLSLAGLQCLMPALRRWTASCKGRVPPAAVLRAIQLCCQLGSGGKRSADPRLAPKTLKRIMSFAFGGSARLWGQIVKARLEHESVY